MELSQSEYNTNSSDKSILLGLPTELIFHILSFLTARDRVQLRLTSNKLRSVSETPSLWREFVWPYYYSGDEGCVKNVLKLCGQHVKRLSFPNRVTSPSRLVKILGYCSNAIQLSLPTTQLDPELLGRIIHMRKLDIQWDNNIIQLLEVVAGAYNMKLLTIRVQSHHLDVNSYLHRKVSTDTELWLHYWMSHGCIPHKLNFITELASFYVDALINGWINLNNKSVTHQTGHLEFYTRLKVPLDLYPVIPQFKVDFGKGTSLPCVKSSKVGLQGLEKDVLLAGSTCGTKLVHKASLVSANFEDDHDHSINHLESVIEFDVSFCDMIDLVQLAIACPNLQRLNLKQDFQCLRGLQGLQAIAISCHNLQGLNLLGIPVTEVEDQTHLWEILGDVKLTHLAIELCVLLPSAANKQYLVRSFQKCINLQVLESKSFCNECALRFVDNIPSVLSHFPSLIHCTLTVHNHQYTNALQEVLNSCKKLKYLLYTDDHPIRLLSLSHDLCIQQLYIASCNAEIPNGFLKAVSAHGGLVHVVFNVRSVTSDGISVFINNSPNLITLHIIVNAAIHDSKGTMVAMEEVETRLKQTFSHRRLFTSGSYTVARASTKLEDHIEMERQCSTDLFSLWV